MLRGIIDRMSMNPARGAAIVPSGWLIPPFAADRIGALMTTRAGGSSAAPFDSMNLRDGIGDDAAAVARNQAMLTAAMGAAPVWLEQVHGVRVVRLTPDLATRARPVADASITTERGRACVVQTADCLPVLLAAPNGVGAAHAGWRGLSAGVIEATGLALCEAAGCQPCDLQAWLGPCIGPRHFEVGVDVLQAFGVDATRGDLRRFKPHAPGKWLANLHRLARDRLERLGVERIHADDGCTVEDASRFFSYRRDRITGRMAAAIWLR